MKVKVNKDLCIGCGACQAIAPEVFEIEDDGLACAIGDEVKDSLKEDTMDALEGCPTNAIEEIEDDGLACAIGDEVKDSLKEDTIDALEGCPTNAIEEIE